jgi:UDP-GlcNAc:undecaprenyl-phosphate GlcNAc-1-phosphate transferase
VTLLRKLSGRSASQGGRDHTSHRLVALGLSERRAVWLLYALAAISGFLSTQVRSLALYESVVAILGFTIVLTLTGAYLAGVKVYPSDADLSKRPFVTFLVDLSYKRRIFETLLDAGLIVIAYYAAWSLRFGRMDPTDPNCMMMIRTLPIIVAIKAGVFLATGVYRGLWRYTSVHDLVDVTKSTIIASVASTATILLAFRTFEFAREVFLLDVLLLLMLITSSRVAFRVARRLLAPPRAVEGRPVLIYGAGDAGELLLREIFNNPDLGYRPVALIDDDRKKVGSVVHGLRVYAGDTLREVCESLAVQEVLVSTSRLRDGRRDEVIAGCDSMGIPLRQMRIELTPINSWDRDPLAEQPSVSAPEPRLPVRAHGSTYVVDASAMMNPKGLDS